MVKFNDGSIYVRNLSFPTEIGETQQMATASLEIAHRALVGYKNVRIEVFIDGEKVREENDTIWATALSWFSWDVEYPVDVTAGEHSIRFRFSYVDAGDLIENVESSFTKAGTPPSDPSPPSDPDPDPPAGSYAVSLQAPSAVTVGEPFAITATVCCDGQSECPATTYSLTLGNRTLEQTDYLLGPGECESASASASNVTVDQSGTYTITATAGQQQATQSLIAEAEDQPPTDPTPPDEPAQGNIGPLLLGGFMFLASEDDD